MKQISWKTITLIAAVLALFAVGVSVYRADLQSDPTPATGSNVSGKGIVLSTASKQELIKLMEKEALIVTVTAVSIDLAKNQLAIQFLQSENPAVQKLWEEYKAKGIPVTPAFSNVPETNMHISRIINGDFGCFAFKTEIEIPQGAPWVCAMTVPPGLHGSGDLVGFINFHMTREPTLKEKTRLAAEVAVISRSIYQRDVENAQRH